MSVRSDVKHSKGIQAAVVDKGPCVITKVKRNAEEFDGKKIEQRIEFKEKERAWGHRADPKGSYHIIS